MGVALHLWRGVATDVTGYGEFRSHARSTLGVMTNKEIVMHAWGEFATRDRGRVTAVFAENAEWLAPPGNATAMALDGSHHLVGRDRIVRFITEEFGTVFVADVDFNFRGVYGDGETVVVETRLQAQIEGGARYDNDYCFVFELREGLIHRVREYMDTQRGAQIFASVVG